MECKDKCRLRRTNALFFSSVVVSSSTGLKDNTKQVFTKNIIFKYYIDLSPNFILNNNNATPDFEVKDD